MALGRSVWAQFASWFDSHPYLGPLWRRDWLDYARLHLAALADAEARAAAGPREEL